MKAAVADRDDPIFSGFKQLSESPHARADYRLRGPFPEWGRAPNIHTGEAVSDATAAYQNALMWAVTGNRDHARKSIEIINAWAGSLKRVTGIDGVLAAGLQGFMFVNAAEILRYTDSGWKESDAKRCEQWFMDAWHPTIKHYAYFANANWESAALQTKMAIAVYCNDRRLFEETIRYAVNGAGNGSITHTVVYPTGQCQETTRAQHYAQLGLGLLGGAAEVAWNQGVDLYGWEDNRILKGFEYTAKYGLGEAVPYQHYLDRTGKYGLGGRHTTYDKISTVSRGSFWPIFERTFHHYANRRKLPAPYVARVVQMKRPEGHSGDHVGLGTLTHWRPEFEASKPARPPGIPAGLVARMTKDGIRLAWVRSVESVSCTDALSYTVRRASNPSGPYKDVAARISTTHYLDRSVKKGDVYYYTVSAANAIGESHVSAKLAAGAGLPGVWQSTDVGNVGVSGTAKYDGRTFSLEGEGDDIGGKSDQFHYAYAPMTGDGTITARIVLPMSSQWSKVGVMMRESLDADSPHASVLLLPHWHGTLVTRSEKGVGTNTAGATHLGAGHMIKKIRLMKPYWVRLVRTRNTFTGFIAPNGRDWKRLASAEITMGNRLYIGLPACSQLNSRLADAPQDKSSQEIGTRTVMPALIDATSLALRRSHSQVPANHNGLVSSKGRWVRRKRRVGMSPPRLRNQHQMKPIRNLNVKSISLLFVVVGWLAVITSSVEAQEKEDILAGHPRPSYDDVTNIDAMEKALRESLAARGSYSFSRGWWGWDRLRARYVDGGRKDANALRILRAVFRGLILDWHAKLQAKGEGDLLYIFFTTLRGDKRERILDVGGRTVLRDIHGGGYHGGWGSAARMRIYEELVRGGALTIAEQARFKQIVHQSLERRFIDFRAKNQNATNHAFGNAGGIAIALRLFPNAPQAKQAQAWLDRIWKDFSDFGDWKEWTYYPYGPIFLHGMVDLAEEMGKFETERKFLYAIGRRCLGFVHGGGLRGNPNSGASATYPQGKDRQEEIYSDPWNRGYYKVEQPARDGHFWYRMAQHFKDPEFLWAAEQVLLGG